jgi:hypothetical protein
MESHWGCRQIEQRNDMDSYPREDQAFMKPSISSQPAFDQLMSRYLTIFRRLVSPALSPGDFTVVTDLRYLPSRVTESFCNVEDCNYGGTKFMVNPGETMSTDYILPGVPNKRLVFAALNRDSAVVVYERGGYVNFLRTTILDFRDGKTWDTTLNSYPIRNLPDLRVALSQEKYDMADGK